ncbi:MAG: Ig-like domain-containing protein [Eubacterium sp.]|nr:Ig-like domain-containing protein [Eubacterium sp.]
MKKITTKLFIGAMTLAVACGGAVAIQPQSAQAKVKVSKVTVKSPAGSKKTAYVAKGKKISLSTTVSVKPKKSANKKVTYKSSNKKIATVTSKGVVKGVKAGKTKIQVISKKNKKKKATIKIVVKKAAVKKVKLSSSKATLAVNGKTTLKATVTPTKNTYTKLKWKTSNAKVAKVTSKGVVTGVGEGTATITATALDGSKKKATCKVTVGAGIASVEVKARRLVQVTLTSAKALNATDFVLKYKALPDGKNYTPIEVADVETNDNKTYLVRLSEESEIYQGAYLNLTISSLVINKTQEFFVSYVPEYGDAGNTTVERNTTYDVGDTISTTYSIKNTNCVGITSITKVEGVPAGVTAFIAKDKSYVRLKGKFTSVCNGSAMTITGTDEKGTTFTRKILFYVGDETHMVGYAIDNTQVAYVPANAATKEDSHGYDFDYDSVKSLAKKCGVTGGSGSYTYELSGLPANVGTVDEDGEVRMATDSTGRRVATPTGSYSLRLIVKDSNNNSIELPFTLNLVSGVKVTGVVKDKAGNLADGISIYGYTKHDENGSYDSMYASTKKDGTYTAYVVPGNYYTYAETSSNSCAYSVDNNFTSGTVVKNITLPLYRVTLNPGINGAVAYDSSYNITAYDANGQSFNFFTDSNLQCTAYLATGNYTIFDDKESVIYAYSKVNTYDDGDLWPESSLGKYEVYGTFNVTGSGTYNVSSRLNSTED